MANEIIYPSGIIASHFVNLYRLGQVWNGVAFVPITVAARAAGAIAMVNQAGTFDYLASIPAGITKGDLVAFVFIQPGVVIGNEFAAGVAQISWDGALAMDAVTMSGKLDEVRSHITNFKITDITPTTGNLRVWPAGVAHVDGVGELYVVPLVRVDAESPWEEGTL